MRLAVLWATALLLAAAACEDEDDRGGSGGSGGEASSDGSGGADTGNDAGHGNGAGTSSESSRLEGRCQKGPFVRGSTVTIQLLDEELVPSGQQFTVQTENDLGEFRLRSAIDDVPLEVFASGFFFNEVAGKLSTAPIALRAVTASKNAGVNVNILTHLQSFRIASLVESGSTAEQAFVASHAEVLASFGIATGSIPAFSAMNLIEEGDGNASLLAVSAIVTQAAAARGDAVEAELTELLSALADDLADDGTIDSVEVSGELQAAAQNLDIISARAHLDAWFEEHEIGSPRPTFEKFVDIDGDGLLAEADDDSDGDGLLDAEDPEPYVQEPAWAEGEPMSIGRRRPAVCTIGNRIFVFGGVDAPTSAEVYDAASSEWTTLAALPADMSFTGCAVLGDLIYIFGRTGTFAYDPATDTYVPRATMPSPRDRFASVAVDGVAYIMGGYTVSQVNEYTATAEYSDKVHVYAPATDQWSSRAPLPLTLGEIAAVSLDGQIFALGGNFEASNDKAFVYDVSANEWSEIARMQRPRIGGVAVALGGFVYFLGGTLVDIDQRDERDALMNVERYAPGRDEWVTGTTIRQKQSEPSGAVLDGSVYVLGDWSKTGSAATVGIYRPQFDAF
jgi:hypothetical protein